MRVDPGDLALFAWVVEEGSFSKAAERLDVPTSTVSRRISMLETRLGERLITRTTRKMVVTDYGEAVLRHAQQIVAELEAVHDLTEHRQAAPAGQLRISMPGDFTQDMIGKLLSGFITDYPGVSLDIDVSQRRVDVIGENFDVALRMGKLQDDSTLAARQIGQFSVALYASPTYLRNHGQIQRPDDLMAHSVLKLQRRGADSESWQMSCEGQQWEGAPPVRAVANSPSVLINLALCHSGITCLATHFAKPYLATARLVRVLPDWECPSIPVWAVFPGRRLIPTRTRAFIDSLVGGLGDTVEQ